jgi:hypothetical protein
MSKESLLFGRFCSCDSDEDAPDLEESMESFSLERDSCDGRGVDVSTESDEATLLEFSGIDLIKSLDGPLVALFSSFGEDLGSSRDAAASSREDATELPDFFPFGTSCNLNLPVWLGASGIC